MKKYISLNKAIIFILVCVFVTMSISQADAFIFGQKSTLKQVKSFFLQENYAQIYKMFLFRIPTFNPKSKTSESLFYYFNVSQFQIY